MKVRITAITEWFEDRGLMDGDASHVGRSAVTQALAREYEQKVDKGIWPDIPFVCEVEGDLESEGEGEALEQYNAKHPQDFLVASGCEWEYVADCFKCSHRRGRSPLDPDLVGCENRTSYTNYHKVQSEGCAMFKEATESELRRIAALDNMRIHEECE